MEFLTVPFEIKSDNGNDGVITGYGSVFGNVDSYGDIVAKGAFKSTIQESKSGAKSWPAMLLQHGGTSAEDKMPVGIWLDMSEDSKGLRLTGKLANTKRGKDTYELLKMRPRPALNGLSIGYRAKEYEMHKAGQGPGGARRTLKAIDLVECSLVTFPANTRARITGVKSGLHTEPLPEPMSMKELAWIQFLELRRLTNTNRIGR
jgi:uncharacterized protein